MTTDLLIIMAKYPTPGKVKTRLATVIGKRAAAAVYRQLIEHHRREFDGAAFDVEWRYTPARTPFRKMVGQASCLSTGRQRHRQDACPTLRPQPPGPLGARMRRSFAEAFARCYGRVVMIGSDCPTMNQRTVRRAFRLLRKFPAVFQPTEDGGYALVGLTGMLDIFTGISWSTSRVMTQTRRRLQSHGVSFRELPVTFDVDTAADLKRLRKGFS